MQRSLSKRKEDSKLLAQQKAERVGAVQPAEEEATTDDVWATSAGQHHWGVSTPRRDRGGGQVDSDPLEQFWQTRDKKPTSSRRVWRKGKNARGDSEEDHFEEVGW